jgi:hypothetical protein
MAEHLADLQKEAFVGPEADDHWWSLGLILGENRTTLLAASGAVETNGQPNTVYGYQGRLEEVEGVNGHGAGAIGDELERVRAVGQVLGQRLAKSGLLALEIGAPHGAAVDLESELVAGAVVLGVAPVFVLDDDLAGLAGEGRLVASVRFLRVDPEAYVRGRRAGGGRGGGS